MKKIEYWNAVILAILFGSIGLQEFYTKHYVRGILAVLFCWTCIPALVALIEVAVWLFKGKETVEKEFYRDACPECEQPLL